MRYQITDLSSPASTATADGRDNVAEVLHSWFAEAPEAAWPDIADAIEAIRTGLGGREYTGDHEAYLNIVITPTGDNR